MNRVTINLEALQHNLAMIARWMERRGSDWTVGIKSLFGHEPTIRALSLLGVRSMADSRLENLEEVARIAPDTERWYLRLPAISSAGEVVRRSEVSLNSEVVVIEALSRAAEEIDGVHQVVIMIEIGDLREGILPGSLIRFYERIFELPNIEVLGIGARHGGLGSAIPSIDQLTQLVMYRELLELKFRRKLPVISAGSSVSLAQMTDDWGLPKQINHFRIGESLFLGSDVVRGGTLQGLRDDVAMLEAEIAEIKEKPLIPMGEGGSITPFETSGNSNEVEPPSPGERGYRALVNLGQLDTDVTGLTPLAPEYHIAGASSDITVVNLGQNPGNLQVGDRIRFRMSYLAFASLMGNRYVDKQVIPPLSAFEEGLAAAGGAVGVPPISAGVGKGAATPVEAGEGPAGET